MATWKTLEKVPYSLRSNLQAITSSEFIGVRSFMWLRGSLCKYSADTDSDSGGVWGKYSGTDTPVPEQSNVELYYDKASDHVFIGCRTCAESSNSLRAFNLSYESVIEYPVIKMWAFNAMVLVQGELHIFGVHVFGKRDSVKHCILDIANKEIEEKRDLPEGVIEVLFASYLKSKRSIIMYVRQKNILEKALYEYSIENKQYVRVIGNEDKLKLNTKAAVCSLNERYIVLFYGFHYIVVCDLLKKTVTESTIRCPANDAPYDASYRAVLLGNKQRNEITTFGFVKKEYKGQDMKDTPEIPVQVIQLMSQFYSNEMVHLVDGGGKLRRHWKINLDDIIQSTIDQNE